MKYIAFTLAILLASCGGGTDTPGGAHNGNPDAFVQVQNQTGEWLNRIEFRSDTHQPASRLLDFVPGQTRAVLLLPGDWRTIALIDDTTGAEFEQLYPGPGGMAVFK